MGTIPTIFKMDSCFSCYWNLTSSYQSLVLHCPISLTFQQLPSPNPVSFGVYTICYFLISKTSFNSAEDLYAWAILFLSILAGTVAPSTTLIMVIIFSYSFPPHFGKPKSWRWSSLILPSKTFKFCSPPSISKT